jgi:hypothetical protein
MNAGDKFTFEGKEYVFWKESGETHFFAHECHANMKTRRIAYADLITATAEVEGTNVRFVAFMVFTACDKTGAARNVRFMSWIAAAVSAYAKSKGEPHSPISPFKISDHDDFSRFIVANGRAFSG